MIKSINNIPLYSNNIHFKSNYVQKDNSPREYNDAFFIDSKGAEALRNYNLVNSPTDITEPMSKEDYKNKLISAGLVENKDFEDFHESILIFDKNNRLCKEVDWFNGGDSPEHYSGYSNILKVDENGLPEIRYTYDKNNILTKKTKTYENIANNQYLIPNELRENPTQEQYINYLKNNNIPYELENDNTIIEKYQDNGMKLTSWNSNSIYQVVYEDMSKDNQTNKSIHISNKYINISENLS